MAASKLPTRYFSNARAFCFEAKRKNSFDSPWSMFCGGRAAPLIMFCQTQREIAGYAGVVQRLISLAYYDINVVKVSHLGACQAVAFWSDERLTITSNTVEAIMQWLDENQVSYVPPAFRANTECILMGSRGCAILAFCFRLNRWGCLHHLMSCVSGSGNLKCGPCKVRETTRNQAMQRTACPRAVSVQGVAE